MTRYGKVLAMLLSGNGVVPTKWLEDYFGIKMTTNANELFMRTMRTYKIKPRVWNKDMIDRYAFEIALQLQGMTSAKMIGVKYGMDESSAISVVRALHAAKMARITDDDVESCLVDVDLFKKNFYSLPEMNRATFATQSSLSRALHKAIRQHCSIAVTEIKCVTSSALTERPVELAYGYDIVSGRPIGVKYRVWLDFGKPLQLEPDYCSPRTALISRGLNDAIVGSKPQADFSPEVIRTCSENADC